MQNTTAQSQQESKKNKSATCLVLKPCYKNTTCAHLMSLAQDNGTFIKSRYQQHVICIQTSKRTHLNSFSSRLLYSRSNSSFTSTNLLVGALVGGEMVSWFEGRRGILNIVLENLRNIEYLPEKCSEYGTFQ